jgi:hypothetical protein
MTHATNSRALARLESKKGSKESSLSRLVGMIEQGTEERRRAVLALVAYAQELAGVEPPAAAPEPLRDEPPAPCADPVAAPPPPSRAPVWGGDRRPGPHDVLTWEEVMRVPWVEGEAAIAGNSPPSPRR